ncbi:hypothetical protein LJR153_003419 [Paenibacillus sp. LjRoot153]|uniref:hypothetical protein n=1 Tax=Paenibacillus sp. LjRoot153 TaxID=3342270 RepID=UPI003ECE4832
MRHPETSGSLPTELGAARLCRHEWARASDFFTGCHIRISGFGKLPCSPSGRATMELMLIDRVNGRNGCCHEAIKLTDYIVGYCYTQLPTASKR